MGGGLHRLSFSSPPPLARWCRSPYLMFGRPFGFDKMSMQRSKMRRR